MIFTEVDSHLGTGCEFLIDMKMADEKFEIEKAVRNVKGKKFLENFKIPKKCQISENFLKVPLKKQILKNFISKF